MHAFVHFQEKKKEKVGLFWFFFNNKYWDYCVAGECAVLCRRDFPTTTGVTFPWIRPSCKRGECSIFYSAIYFSSTSKMSELRYLWCCKETTRVEEGKLKKCFKGS